jgi:hypothetical protein
MFMHHRLLVVIGIFFSIVSLQVYGQDKPIGYWQSHLPYNTAVSICTDGTNMYTATDKTFFIYNSLTEEKTPYSKVEGMADLGMTYTAYDAATETVVLAYSNSNIDLYHKGTFYNIPDIKLKTITGNKTIYHIYTEGGYAYMSTGFGVVVIDLTKREISETYNFIQNNQTIGVFAFTASSNKFYAATNSGVYYVLKNKKNLQDYSVWNVTNEGNSYAGICTSGGKIYVSDTTHVYNLIDDTTWTIAYTTSNSINHIDESKSGLWISEYNSQQGNGIINKINLNNDVVDAIHNVTPAQVKEMSDGTVWVADTKKGLKKRVSADNLSFEPPQGPSYYYVSDIQAYNREVWVTHGGIGSNLRPTGNTSGFSVLKADKWVLYTKDNFPPLIASNVKDFFLVARNSSKDINYLASYGQGLFYMKKDSNDLIKENEKLDDASGNPGSYYLTGLVYDNDDNLWINCTLSEHQLAVKTKNGAWYKYSIPINGPGVYHLGLGVIVDDYGQKWYYVPGGGVAVFNDNGTIDDITDDKSYQFQSGVGSGNLPSNVTNCIVKDKSGSIWVGTDNGIGIINCPSEAVNGTCDAEQRIVQYDQFAGYLFEKQPVKTIAVDGADRKWVGTNNGVWLLTSDASKIIYRLTTDNSPLPSNSVQKISIDPVTGDVYIATSLGMVSYRSTATEGGTSNSNVLIYPNPIKSGYNGTIAIKGLVSDGDVRITDVSGQLVYRTTALGGQAVWSGTDYTGHRPTSGVYLVFVTNKDGSQSYVAKMVFME